MANNIPDSHRDLFEGPVYAVITTLMPDGQPQSTVVWANMEGKHVMANTALGRQKPKNIARDPRVSIIVIDPENAFRWIEVRGTAELIEEGALEHINALAKLYVGADAYYGSVTPAEMQDKETRVKIKITPTRVIAFGE